MSATGRGSFGPVSVPSGRRPVIAGLGLTEIGKVFGLRSIDFAAQAVRLAAADAGVRLADIDGLLTSAGVTPGPGLALGRMLGLTGLRLQSDMQSFGATAGAMVQYAAMAVMTGMAETVACVFADAPLREGRSAGRAYDGSRFAPEGWRGLLTASGIGAATTMYALAAQRHMNTYGTTSEQLGHVAVAQRQWAALNPLAQMRDPITLEDHQSSRWVAEPLHLLDCCLVSNGGVAVIVTSAERAAALAQPPVHVLGWAQAHPGRSRETFGLVSGRRDGRTASAGHGGPRDSRHRRRRAVRLLHLHRHDHARGLRLLRQGGGRAVRRERRARARPGSWRSTPAAASCPATTCGA